MNIVVVDPSLWRGIRSFGGSIHDFDSSIRHFDGSIHRSGSSIRRSVPSNRRLGYNSSLQAIHPSLRPSSDVFRNGNQPLCGRAIHLNFTVIILNS